MIFSDTYFLKKALEQAQKAYAQGEVPIGAVLVLKNRIISEGFNLREAQNDPTAHAEIVALQKASQKLKSWRLGGTTLYVTCEPCLMCAGALLQARIERLVYGCTDPKAGAVSSLYQTLQDSRLNHQIIVQGGVLEEECRELLQKFFKLRRGVRAVEGARLESV
ncbi:MAG: tRNA adenosine(34) deaminase TadA [Deltaproteobacteria bacterium]|nr:tRNA adenosine(34) deaminase TadA [Deltaproteobacteria bacterium]